MSLSKTLYPMLSTGSTQEDPSRHDLENVDWHVTNLSKQKNKECSDYKSGPKVIKLV